ncbi:MAG: metallophosphoesterase, partial [Candidatus Hodarchaeota archaeon]
MALDQTVKMKTNHKTKKRIVIISDTHITPSGTEFNIKAFNKGIEKINKIKNVTLFLHLGDIT